MKLPVARGSCERQIPISTSFSLLREQPAVLPPASVLSSLPSQGEGLSTSIKDIFLLVQLVLIGVAPQLALWPSAQVGCEGLSPPLPLGEGWSPCAQTLCFDPTSDSGFIIFPGTVIMPLIVPGNGKPQMRSAWLPCRSQLYYECER